MALGPGSIAFTGFNADGNDNLSFVVLENIASGTTIHFQDNEWDGTAFNSGKSAFSWTATGTIAAGTVVTIDNIGTGTVSSNLGTVVFADASNRGLSNSDEIVYAFVGTSATAPTAFLTAVTNELVRQRRRLACEHWADGRRKRTRIHLRGSRHRHRRVQRQPRQSRQFYRLRRRDQRSVELDHPGRHRRPVRRRHSPGRSVLHDGLHDHRTVGTDRAVCRGFADGFADRGQHRDDGVRVHRRTHRRHHRRRGLLGPGILGGANSQDFAGAPALPFAFNGTIPAGQASVTVTVNVAGDVAVEAAENFTLALQAATNTLSVPTTIDAAQDEATGTIQNDDAAAGITILAEAESLQGQAGTPTATNAIELVRLGSFAATGGNAEVVSFDPTSDQLYILNTTGNKIEIVQIGATGSLTKTGEIDLSTLTEFGGANSVAIKNGVVAVAYGNATAGEAGHVALFNAAGVLQTTVEVGVLPDMLTFTPDGSRILVANEAEPVSAANNPAGTISIINLAGGAASATVSNTISFASLNGQRRRAGAGRPCAVPGPVGGQRHRA